jgi:predicted secreted protein
MAIQAQGSIFYWSSSTTPTTNNAIGEVKSFSGPSGSAGIIDITHLGSTAKEKLIGLRDEGQITFECNLMTSAAAGQQLMRGDRATRSQRAWSIILADSTTSPTRLNGVGYCTGFSVSGGVDDVVKASITVEIDGAVSWTTA